MCDECPQVPNCDLCLKGEPHDHIMADTPEKVKALASRVDDEALARLESVLPIPRYVFKGKKEDTHAKVSKPKRAAARKRERQNKRRGR